MIKPHFSWNLSAMGAKPSIWKVDNDRSMIKQGSAAVGSAATTNYSNAMHNKGIAGSHCMKAYL